MSPGQSPPQSARRSSDGRQLLLAGAFSVVFATELGVVCLDQKGVLIWLMLHTYIKSIYIYMLKKVICSL